MKNYEKMAKCYEMMEDIKQKTGLDDPEYEKDLVKKFAEMHGIVNDPCFDALYASYQKKRASGMPVDQAKYVHRFPIGNQHLV